MKMTQLSVSSAILAAVLSGCSQQVSAGPHQVYGGSQIATGSQVSSQQQIEGGNQVSASQQYSGGSQQSAGGSQVGTTQQQVESAAPIVQTRRAVVQTRRAVVHRPTVHKKRVYRPKPRPRHTVSNGLPAAQPGQCFAKVKLPAKYVTKSRRVFLQKASTRRVLVRAPQYRWINKRVLVRKASYRTRVIPAQYKTVVNRVMIKPAYNTWRRGHGAITRIDNMTGEIMCRVKIPAVYKTVKKRVLVRPQKVLRTLIPAVYKTIKQKQRVSGALYKTIHKPARYKTQNYRVKVGGARYVWRAVLCKTNAPKKRAAKHYAPKRRYAAAPRKHYRKAASRQNYRKAAPRRVYKAQRQAYKEPRRAYRAPQRQYYQPRVIHKPVVRYANYKKQYNNSGVNYQDYMRVMNAGKSISSSVSSPYQNPRTVARKVSYRNAVHIKKPQSRVDTRKGIVYGIQKALLQKGFDPGAMDGKMGAGTAAALKAFQNSRGLPVGKLSKETFRALGMIR